MKRRKETGEKERARRKEERRTMKEKGERKGN